MKKTQKHTKFKHTEELINKIINFIDTSNDKSIKDIFIDFHHADVSEILEELNSSQATYIIKLLDSEKTSDVLMEFDHSEIYEPVDLKVGKCRLSVAGPKELVASEDPMQWSHLRIATKYPNITKKYFAER